MFLMFYSDNVSHKISASEYVCNSYDFAQNGEFVIYLAAPDLKT